MIQELLSLAAGLSSSHARAWVQYQEHRLITEDPVASQRRPLTGFW